MSEPINDGGPAFPSEQTAMVRLIADGVFDPADPRNFAEGTRVSPGMSLRDYFAGQALGPLMATGNYDLYRHQGQIAAGAYDIADAMLKAREVAK